MEWFVKLFSQVSIAQTVIAYGIAISIGIWLGRIKLGGISLGVTCILFAGLLFSYLGLTVDKNTEDFLKDFGLILFVYSIGLQVGPGFFASLKKNALTNNLLAAAIVVCGVLLTILFHFISGNSMPVMAGVMSGAVTNTPGLGAAQTAITDLNIGSTDKSLITLAYAVTYPLGVFGIIGSLLLLKKIFGVNIEKENEFHRKLGFLKPSRLVAIHLALENKQLIGQPLRTLFELVKDHIVVSRMYHNEKIITPTPSTILAEGDILLIVSSKKQTEQLKLLIGPPATMNLKAAPENQLQNAHIVVTRSSVTHKRIGDMPELQQQDFTLTRLYRAGIEIVPHGETFLQLGDNITAVGTKEGIEYVGKTLGNSQKSLEVPNLAPIFLGIVLGVILGSIPIHFPDMPVAVKIGLAGGPLIAALLLSRFGNLLYLNNYTTNSANLMIRELGISLFLASVGFGSGKNLSVAFTDGSAWLWMAMGIVITIVPLVTIGIIARKYFKKTFFEICGLLAGASTDPPALAFATKMAGNDIPSVTYATVYPLTMILRIVMAQLLILLLL